MQLKIVQIVHFPKHNNMQNIYTKNIKHIFMFTYIIYNVTEIQLNLSTIVEYAKWFLVTWHSNAVTVVTLFVHDIIW